MLTKVSSNLYHMHTTSFFFNIFIYSVLRAVMAFYCIKNYQPTLKNRESKPQPTLNLLSTVQSPQVLHLLVATGLLIQMFKRRNRKTCISRTIFIKFTDLTDGLNKLPIVATFYFCSMMQCEQN